MKLLAKFNLILLALFVAGLALIAVAANEFLMRNARDQVVRQAELMIENARSTRQYTVDELAPLLNTVPDHNTRFLPETIPFYAATTTFNYLRAKYPEYAYKEAALNPSNPRDRAADWEADLIYYFRTHKDAPRVIGERQTSAGPALYIAYPIKTEGACLTCHGDPRSAPDSILQTYGGVNGFGWTAGEITAAQIISVPMTVPVGIARQAFRALIAYLIVTFIAAMALLDAALLFIVIRPVQRLSAMADRISSGDTSLAELPVNGKDEIAEVTASINRMSASLRKAFRMLNP